MMEPLSISASNFKLRRYTVMSTLLIARLGGAVQLETGRKPC
jgi:hypothetical protein